MARRKPPIIPDAILDQLLGGADPKTVFVKDGLLDELKKALAARVLNAEMDQHLASGAGNSRNGYGHNNGADRHGQDCAGYSSRSTVDVRSAVDCEISAAFSRLRRKDRVY